MKKTLLALAIGALSMSAQAKKPMSVYDEASLQAAIEEANTDNTVGRIVFKKNAHIALTAPVIYGGTQPLKLVGNGAVIDGQAAGSFDTVLDSEGLEVAVTEDGSIVFNTQSDITIKDLSVVNSGTRGIVVNVPQNAEGDDIAVALYNVRVTGSALYGLHVDDNSDEFDDGESGSAIGVDLEIHRSAFIANGTGALDFDGVRVDERGEGDISSWIVNTVIDGNGGDGIELDEAGEGNVFSTMNAVSLSGNGFYNEEDLDDGFDIDEAGEGSIFVTLNRVQANNNLDEGLDFDEAGSGDLNIVARHVVANNNSDEAIKADEEGRGDITVHMTKVIVNDAGDDGVQITELGEGKIAGFLNRVTVNNSAKYGIKAEQWVEEDEEVVLEPAGYLKTRKVVLGSNLKGDEIKVNNVSID